MRASKLVRSTAVAGRGKRALLVGGHMFKADADIDADETAVVQYGEDAAFILGQHMGVSIFVV